MKTRGSRSLVPAALLSLVCAANASCSLVGMFRPRDEGGSYMVVAVRAERPALAQAVPQTVGVIETRCSAVGFRCKVERLGGEDSDSIKVYVPGARDLGRLKALLLADARLELRPVVSRPNPSPVETYPTREAAAEEAGSRYDVVPYESEGEPASFIVVERQPVVSGADMRTANAARGYSKGEYQINFTLRPEGAQRFGWWTSANIGRYIAVVLNGRARSAAFIKSQITDSGVINGKFTKEEAEDLALLLRSGGLPAPVELVEEGAYKP